MRCKSVPDLLTKKVLQVDDTEVINFLLSTEIIPLCLRTMEMGSELSKTVATFIVQKILLDNVGCMIIIVVVIIVTVGQFCDFNLAAC